MGHGGRPAVPGGPGAEPPDRNRARRARRLKAVLATGGRMFPCCSARRRPRQGPSGPALRFRPWLGFVIPLCCAGCLVGPDFSAPSAPVAEKWLEANNPSVDTRNQEYRDWWSVFRDPVLNRLIEIAYNQNLTLVSAGTRVLQARAELGVAIGEFYPQVQQGNGSVTYIRPSHADTTQFPVNVARNFWRDSLGLTVNWELDFRSKERRVGKECRCRWGGEG